MNCRPRVKHMVRYSIGRNSTFLFWQDPWLHNRAILDQFSTHIITHSGTSNMALAADFMRNDMWDIPLSNYVELIDLRLLVAEIPINSKDTITWDGL